MLEHVNCGCKKLSNDFCILRTENIKKEDTFRSRNFGTTTFVADRFRHQPFKKIFEIESVINTSKKDNFLDLKLMIRFK